MLDLGLNSASDSTLADALGPTQDRGLNQLGVGHMIVLLFSACLWGEVELGDPSQPPGG